MGNRLQKTQRFIFYSFTNDSFHRVNFAIICTNIRQNLFLSLSRQRPEFFLFSVIVPNAGYSHCVTECTQSVNWNYCRIRSTQIRDIVVYYLPFSFLTSVPSTAKYTNISHHEFRAFMAWAVCRELWCESCWVHIQTYFFFFFLVCIYRAHSNEMIYTRFAFPAVWIDSILPPQTTNIQTVFFVAFAFILKCFLLCYLFK